MHRGAGAPQAVRCRPLPLVAGRRLIADGVLPADVAVAPPPLPGGAPLLPDARAVAVWRRSVVPVQAQVGIRVHLTTATP